MASTVTKKAAPKAAKKVSTVKKAPATKTTSKKDGLSFEKKCVIFQIVLIVLVLICKIFVVKANIVDEPINIFCDYGLWIVILIGLFPTIKK